MSKLKGERLVAELKRLRAEHEKGDPFPDLPRGHFGAILADPPWRFKTWNGATVVQARNSKSTYKSASAHYQTLEVDELAALPVQEIAASDCSLFLWTSWPMLVAALDVLSAWGFQYKTCAFDWMKAHTGQIEMFRDDADALMGMGYWTRANSEPCLLATRGKPKRLNADVRQGIIAPRREHSRKPDEVHGRIERLVAGPYLELFARAERPGWTCWGNETTKFNGRRPSEPEQLSWDDMWSQPFDRPELVAETDVAAIAKTLGGGS